MTGLWCLTVLRPPMNAPRSATAGVLGVLTCVTSPLAGLFLAVAAGTMLLDRRPGRPRAGATWLVLGLLVTTALVTLLLFPGVGVMPFPAANALPATVCAVAVAAFCPDRRIRIGACAYLVLLLLLLLHATAVGVNVTRLAWIFALPVTVAYARLNPRALVAVATALALLPALDLAGQLQASSDPSAQGSFYRPLLSALDGDLASHPNSLGQRVEMIDPRSHWSAAYLPGRFSLARGWERQMDRAANPMFYRDRRLTNVAYRRWLQDMAVRWVALPTGPLDYASEREARLVARHPAYLDEIWSNEDWRLYRVRDAGPLAWPATVVAIDDRTVTVDVGAVTTVNLALRWSPYLVVTDGSGVQGVVSVAEACGATCRWAHPDATW